MKFIEGIRGKHTGEKIWVAGSGKSLDDYPIDFFKDKVCIGMNWVFAAFTDIGDGLEKFKTRAFYSVHEHSEPAEDLVKYAPHLLKDCFFLLPPSRRDTPRRMVWWEDYNDDPTYMRWGLVGHGGVRASDEEFEEMAKCIMEKKDECYYVCRCTTLHWAIDAAVVLGAKKICLVGADRTGPGNRGHAQEHGLSAFYSSTPIAKRPFWEGGTRALMSIFGEYGIEIVFYYYGKGEQV